MPGSEALAQDLARRLQERLEAVELRRFPDGEHHVRLTNWPGDARRAIVVADLSRPDPILLPLVFAADALHAQGAERVTLVAPYLPYMRQDRAFQPGEAVSSASFARLLSAAFDGLVTVDPHLHRRAGLEEIFAIPTRVVSAAPALGAWIAANVADPFVVGPDAESARWARPAAQAASAPLVVLEKQRLGDRRVEIDAGALADPALAGRTPVIVDDILSSGTTARRVAELVRGHGFAAPILAVTHNLARPAALRRLAPSFARIVCADTIPGSTGEAPVAPILAAALADGEI